MRTLRCGLLVLAVLAVCPSCRSLIGGPPDVFWRWQDRPGLAFERWQDDEPIGRVRHMRTLPTATSPIQSMPRVSYVRASSLFTWEGGGAQFEYSPEGVHRSASGRECFRWERVD